MILVNKLISEQKTGGVMIKKRLRKLYMKITLKMIDLADDLETTEIILAVCRATERKYPDWESYFLSLPKYDRRQRETSIDCWANFARKHVPPERS